jgi:hypothetical protein
MSIGSDLRFFTDLHLSSYFRLLLPQVHSTELCDYSIRDAFGVRGSPITISTGAKRFAARQSAAFGIRSVAGAHLGSP